MRLVAKKFSAKFKIYNNSDGFQNGVDLFSPDADELLDTYSDGVGNSDIEDDGDGLTNV